MRHASRSCGGLRTAVVGDYLNEVAALLPQEESCREKEPRQGEPPQTNGDQ